MLRMVSHAKSSWLFLLVAIAGWLSACAVVSYGPIPIEPAPPPKKEGIVRFFYHTGAVQNPTAEKTTLPAEFRILQEILEERAGFAAAIVSSTPQAKGLHITVYQSEKKGSSAGRVFCTLAMITLFALPCYSDTGGSVVQYDVYVDDGLKKNYRYEITKTEFAWIGLLPFAWVNGLTAHYQDAFKATAYQFLRDGRSDGYFNAQ